MVDRPWAVTSGVWGPVGSVGSGGSCSNSAEVNMFCQKVQVSPWAHCTMQRTRAWTTSMRIRIRKMIPHTVAASVELDFFEPGWGSVV